MSSLPVRFLLLYDPLFLELAHLLRSTSFCPFRGVSWYAVCRSFDDVRETMAAVRVLFGGPDSFTVSQDTSAGLIRAILLYGGRPVSLTAALLPSAQEAVAINGSISTAAAILEIRKGTERLLACSVADAPAFRVALPEGDATYYRAIDERKPGGPAVVSVELDQEARAFAASFSDRVARAGFRP